MWIRVVAVIFIFGLAITLVKIAFLFLFIVGFLFKPRETAGLVGMFVILWLIERFPLPSFCLIALLLGVAVWEKIVKPNLPAGKAPAPQLLVYRNGRRI